jgi:shikimate dehydrogenase
VKRLGVLGWPVAHSRSPAMHRAAFATLGLGDWTYQHLPVPPELLADTVGGLPGAGFVGANVTIPHKEAALALADTATPRARAIGAANTLSFDAGTGALHADNTDAPGLIAALPVAAAGSRALVLGAGGSARAVAWALHDAGAEEVWVWNRNPERAERLAADLGVRATREAPAAEILVNCTPAGLAGAAPQFKGWPVEADHLSNYACVIDLVYVSRGTTPLLRAAEQAGCAVVDGLEILVRQGAESLSAWTGRQAPLQAMRQGARGPTPRPDDRAPAPDARDRSGGSGDRRGTGA